MGTATSGFLLKLSKRWIAAANHLLAARSRDKALPMVRTEGGAFLVVYPELKGFTATGVLVTCFTQRSTIMEPFYNLSAKPIFDVFQDEEDGQRVAEFNPAFARQYLELFRRHCLWARERGETIPSEQYAFAKKLEVLI